MVKDLFWLLIDAALLTSGFNRDEPRQITGRIHRMTLLPMHGLVLRGLMGETVGGRMRGKALAARSSRRPAPGGTAGRAGPTTSTWRRLTDRGLAVILLPLTGPTVTPAARTGGSLCAEIVGKPTKITNSAACDLQCALLLSRDFLAPDSL